MCHGPCTQHELDLLPDYDVKVGRVVGIARHLQQCIPAGRSAKGALPLGCQKFTSSKFPSERNLYQLVSVTPAQSFMRL